jgi:hypothetical protein
MPDDVPLVVPFEYRKAGITTAEDAAKLSADVIGFMSCQRAHDSAERAEKRGAHGEAAFYRAVLDILLEWYADRPTQPVTGDEDLPELDRSEIDPDWSAPAPPPPKKRRKPKPKTKARRTTTKSKRSKKRPAKSKSAKAKNTKRR